MESFNLNNLNNSYCEGMTVTSDLRVQCSRVGLEAKIFDTPAGGIRASQGTFLVDKV